MVRSLLALVVLAMVAVPSLGCGESPAEDGEIQVVATTVQIGALAKEVAGGETEITVLITSGVDPHDFELTVSGRKAIDRADVVLRHGMGLDDFLDSAVSESGARLVTVTDGIEPLTSVEGEPDPHTWHDPRRAIIMLDNIATALAAADPANATTYRAAAASYRTTLQEADLEIAAMIASVPAEKRKMVTNHDAFGYFIDRYGLTFVGAVFPVANTQSEPSARDIAGLVELIAREKVTAIFSEETIDPRVARQIAGDTGIRIVDDLYGDSLGEPGSGAETIHGMLLANARTIVDALR